MAARAKLKLDFRRRFTFNRDSLSLFWKIRKTGDQLLLSQRQIDRQRRVAQRISARKYLGAVGHAGDRNAAVRKSVFDGKSLPRLHSNFCAIIGPAMVMKENCVSAWRQIGD